MKFHEQLNAYIEQIDCMAKEVSEQSGSIRRHSEPISYGVEAPRYGIRRL